MGIDDAEQLSSELKYDRVSINKVAKTLTLDGKHRNM